MESEIIVALIAAAGTIVSGVIASVVSRKTTLALVEYRIDQLEKKIDKHNNLIERTYDLEQEVAVLKNEINNIEKGD